MGRVGNTAIGAGSNFAMPQTMPLPLPPTLVKRVDGVSYQGEGDVNAVDTGELSLETAKELAGQIVAATVEGAPLKAVGDKGQVSRWKQGENPNFARLIASSDRRKAMAKALLKTCKGVRLREVYEIEEIA